MYLIIDTETNGLPDLSGLKYCQYPNFENIDKYNTARIVQFTYMLCDNLLNEIRLDDYIIYAENFDIPNSSTRFHGITNEISKNDGYNFNIVIENFYKQLQKCEYIIAHNIGFDINVIKSELFRRKLFHIIIELDKKTLICSMATFKKIVNAKNKFDKIKDPSLNDLYKFAFNKDIENAHNSKYDVINLHSAIKNITNGNLNKFI
tara:strand:+ start:165 stop:779 length:615 start_codon:yes stop_codon:yes gene_type:complete